MKSKPIDRATVISSCGSTKEKQRASYLQPSSVPDKVILVRQLLVNGGCHSRHLTSLHHPLSAFPPKVNNSYCNDIGLPQINDI